MLLPAPCLTPLALELDSVSVLGFTPLPSPWFIQPTPACLSSLPGTTVKRTVPALCVATIASEYLDQSAIRLQSVERFHKECLDYFLFWVLDIISSVRSDLWKLTAGLLFSDPVLLNKPFNFLLCV
ncbi:hypothetical protein ATANTOWER_027691 [Ataeniobius toweri]|uniref:Uncharacterized protein n=1 Tax=Ataeniobius toweri TaxID=208326 RepID=A0ABU7BBL8_9TELE|nr:hypothetical protein [Ataeniobius toweri]